MKKILDTLLTGLFVLSVPLMYIIGLFVLSVPLMFATTAAAVPKTQQSIELQDEISDAIRTTGDKQADLNNLVASAERLEDRLSNNENTIANLEEQSLFYAQKISDLIFLAAQNDTNIAEAVEQINLIDDNLMQLELEETTNAEAITELQDEMVALMDYVTVSTGGLTTLNEQIGNNFKEIASLQAEIVAIQMDLAKKQAIIKSSQLDQ